MTGWLLRKNNHSGEIELGEYGRVYYGRVCDWIEVPVYSFIDTFRFITMKAADGRDPYVYFQGTLQEYRVAYSELNRMIPYMNNGVITGKFTFKKQGKMVSVIFIEPCE